TGDDSNSCASAGDPCRTIDAAIIKAGPFDQIRIAAGTYSEASSPYTGIFTGLFINKSLSITGAGMNSTIISIDSKPDGIFIGGADTLVTISGVSIRDADQRGVYVAAGAKATVRDSRLHFNGFQGAFVEGGELTLDNVIIVDNGGLMGPSSSSTASGVSNRAGKLTIRDSRISRNLNGSGVLSFENGSVRILRSFISANQGFGVFISWGNGSLISESTIAFNRFADDAVSASGIYIENSDVIITNSSVTGNQYAGIYNSGGSGTVSVSYTTVAYNFGPGLTFSGGPTVNLHNILVGPNSTTGNDCAASSLASVTTSGVNIATDDSCFGALSVPIAALGLGTLTDNGGPTPTMALQPGSPAIDAAAGDCPAADQRGFSRPVGAGCDVGAFEAGSVVAPTPIAMAVTGGPPEVVTATPTPQSGGQPSQPPTVNQDTPCWKGPGPKYETVSTVTAGTVVQLVGIGELSGWMVIDNPRFPGVACWIEEGDLDLDPKLDLDELQVIPVPALPTPTATPSPPAAPSKFKAQQVCAGNDYYVILTWKDNSDDESGFRLYRDGKLIATLDPNTTEFIDYPPQGGPYNYTLESFNAVGSSSQTTTKDPGCIL
ncbi:MAG: right-handed parallel beta-helix repeat-containing protein, partial [Anaerolineae bacterium]|nr:right-handed parallel beta-helix repeat-containing protein [Anaerolineae bacterium]